MQPVRFSSSEMFVSFEFPLHFCFCFSLLAFYEHNPYTVCVCVFHNK